jgi:predicted nucleic acid binding AN1-type Zn finger protein
MNSLTPKDVSKSKIVNECLFCKNRFCYERVVTKDMSYDEVACMKHVKDLHKHSDTTLPNVMKSFISSSGVLKRGVPFL